MLRKVSLPDFGKYFHTKNRSPIAFVCRDTPNLFHDIVFMASYLHDAEFGLEDVRRTGKVLRIVMQRDRWELYKLDGDLESIASELVISPVAAVKWHLKPKIGRKLESDRRGTFSIRHLYFAESVWDDTDKTEIVLSGHGMNPAQLRIAVREPFTISLTDRQP
ncbi:MAG: hypothetical protein ACRD5K_18270 [Candidatus Acidiferrales bacterium]